MVQMFGWFKERSLGFPLKTAEGLCIVGEFVRKELQGDVATQLQVFRLVHHTHATPADLSKDAVMGNGLPYGLRRSSHLRECYGEAGWGVNSAVPFDLFVVVVDIEEKWTPNSGSLPPKLIKAEQDLLSHIQDGYQLETNSLGGDSLRFGFENGRPLRPS
jgi:hypothetical protein